MNKKQPLVYHIDAEERNVIEQCMFEHLYRDALCYKFSIQRDTSRVKLTDVGAIAVMDDSLCSLPTSLIMQEHVIDKILLLDSSFRQAFRKISTQPPKNIYIGDIIPNNKFGIISPKDFKGDKKSKDFTTFNRFSRVIFNSTFTIGFFYVYNKSEKILIVRKKDNVWVIDDAIILFVH